MIQRESWYRESDGLALSRTFKEWLQGAIPSEELHKNFSRDNKMPELYNSLLQAGKKAPLEILQTLSWEELKGLPSEILPVVEVESTSKETQREVSPSPEDLSDFMLDRFGGSRNGYLDYDLAAAVESVAGTFRYLKLKSNVPSGQFEYNWLEEEGIIFLNMVVITEHFIGGLTSHASLIEATRYGVSKVPTLNKNIVNWVGEAV